jgi:hypothetical protein
LQRSALHLLCAVHGAAACGPEKLIIRGARATVEREAPPTLGNWTGQTKTADRTNQQDHF